MSISRQMNKKAVVHYTMEYYSAIKNTFESVLMRWMKLEPSLQSEVSQKEKHDPKGFMHPNVHGVSAYNSQDMEAP